MNNQEPQNQTKTTEGAAVENRRRFIKGAGAVTPVILTLASSSVFGQQLCLSQQMSGNASGHPTGSCVPGYQPAYWKNPANKGSWTSAGFTYGSQKSGPTGGDGSSCMQYILGTKFNDATAFGSVVGCSSSFPSPNQTTQPMRAILCGSLVRPESIWAAAMLNTGLNAAHLLNYSLTREQLLGLWVNHNPPHPYAQTCDGTLLFLKATMGL